MLYAVVTPYLHIFVYFWYILMSICLNILPSFMLNEGYSHLIFLFFLLECKGSICFYVCVKPENECMLFVPQKEKKLKLNPSSHHINRFTPFDLMIEFEDFEIKLNNLQSVEYLFAVDSSI